MIDGSTVLERCEQMTVVTVDDSLFVYDETARRFFMLNTSAAAIYEHCDGQRSVDEIAAAMVELHPEGGPRVDADVREAVEGLVELGLVAPS